MTKLSELPTINCDMGEGYGLLTYGADDGLAPYIDVANIACGYHGGDPATIRRTVALAARYRHTIAAHPSLPDREGFGRRVMQLSAAELSDCLLYQLGALSGFVAAEGLQLSWLKPHGQIYMMAARDPEMAAAMCDVAAQYGIGVYGIAGTATEAAAKARGVPFQAEFFADLVYRATGGMIVTKAQAVDVDWVARRITRAVTEGIIDLDDGTTRAHSFQTICIHNDMPNAVEIARSARASLEALRARS